MLGVSERALSLWGALTLAEVLFHHSNVRIPIQWERAVNRILVTPRMHGVHHSNVPEETNANWSSGLTIWDRAHGTLRANVAQDEIEIGVAAYRTPEQVSLTRSLAMPFEPLPPRSLPDGTAPQRAPSAAANARMLP